MLAALRSFLTQEIDLRVLGTQLAGHAATIANGSRKDLIIVEMEGSSIISLNWAEDGCRHTVSWHELTSAGAGDKLKHLGRTRLVLLVIPDADVISFSMPARTHVKASARELVALNFAALSPFPLDALYLQCERIMAEDQTIRANYVMKDRIAPRLEALCNHGIACDGLLFGDDNSEPYLFSQKRRIRKRLVANARTIGLFSVMFTAGLALNAGLTRYEYGISRAEQRLAERIAELRGLSPPGNRILINRAKWGHPSNALTSRTTAFATSLLDTEDALSGFAFDGTVLRMEAEPAVLTRLRQRLELRPDVDIVEAGPTTNGTSWLSITPRAVPP